jgi:hypothetical protein
VSVDRKRGISSFNQELTQTAGPGLQNTNDNEDDFVNAIPVKASAKPCQEQRNK